VNKGISHNQDICYDHTWNSWTDVIQKLDEKYFQVNLKKLADKVAEQMEYPGSLHGNPLGNRAEMFEGPDGKVTSACKAVQTYINSEILKLQKEIFKRLETDGIGFLCDALKQIREELGNDEEFQDSV